MVCLCVCLCVYCCVCVCVQWCVDGDTTSTIRTRPAPLLDQSPYPYTASHPPPTTSLHSPYHHHPSHAPPSEDEGAEGLREVEHHARRAVEAWVGVGVLLGGKRGGAGGEGGSVSRAVEAPGLMV